MADQIFTSPLSSVPLVHKSIFTHLLGTSLDTPHLVGGFPAHSPAFIDAASGASISRRSLRSYALQLARSIHNLPRPLRRPSNATARPTVLVFSPNSIVWPIIFFGAVAAGFTATLANSAFTAAELQHQYLDTGAHFIFVHPALFDVVQQMLTSIGFSDSDIRATVILATSSWLTGVPDPSIQGALGLTLLQDLLNCGELVSEVSFDGEQSNETVCLCYSSGTTGKPKGVETTHYNLTSIVDGFKPVWPSMMPYPARPLVETSQPDVHFGCLPYYHIYGVVHFLLLPISLGTPTVVMAGFDPERFLEAIDKYRATIVLAVPPILVVLARHEAVNKYNLTSIRVMFTAASPISPNVITVVEKRFRSVGSNVIISQMYGLTETPVFMLPLEHACDHVGSVGFVLPNLEVRLIREADGEVLTDLESGGEVWVRGPTVTKGYLNNPMATAAAITPDGWFKTGDIARLDKDGFFTIVDRRKELIKYKGFQVAPAELESVLLQHPGVADAAVIGIENQEEATEFPRAYVVPSQIIPQRDAESFALSVQEWVAVRVAPYKKLRGGIVLVQQIPKSASGKILRRELRGQAKTDTAYGQVTLRAKL
ncbi:AMP binding protein [Scleroderma citrinum]